MGAVNTSYTFTATDTITSAKMNNIIDQTVMTSSAITGTTLQVTTSGQLAVNSQGITSNELASSSVTQAKIGSNVAGKGPAARAWASASTSVPSGIATKILLGTENYDTNSNFANNRFTPTVAGYYLVIAQVGWPTAALNSVVVVYKNGLVWGGGVEANANTVRSNFVDVIFMNGSSDYLELYAKQSSGGTLPISTQSGDTFLSGCLIRSA